MRERDLEEQVQARTRELQAANLYPYFKALRSAPGSEVVVDGHKVIMAGSNNYLGLTQHPKVMEAAKKAVDKYGSGCTGSRFLNGTLDIHEELEARLARFMKKEAALVFSTGFQTNLGAISALVGKEDTAVCDRGDHASIVDGCRLAFGKALKYRHNDMEELEGVLSSIQNGGGVLIVVDGVFSMEGTLANLPGIVKAKRHFGARLMVDDAHGIGVLGEHGRGTGEHFGLEADVDVVMGTFSKSFASLGGFVASTEEVIHFIKHQARALIFSASMPPSAVATALAALDIIESEPDRRIKVRRNADRMRNSLAEMGFNVGKGETPIVPIIIGDEMKVFQFWRRLLEEGVFANPVISPAVAPNNALIRTSYMATHTDEELDKVLRIFERVGVEFGLINKRRRA
ncbi:MAG: pyridoxal phosphate-dependent aminotransferase family protein [Planctomycetota bacterium]|nr:pyridoxal phosphate-dependent aminotransferase family protein [Planctomycetota bacterium]